MKKLLCLGLVSTLLVNCESNQPSQNKIVVNQINSNLLEENSEESHSEPHGQLFQMNFKPLPLFMPTFEIKADGQVKMTNVFDVMENQFQKIEEKMQNQQVKMLQNMVKRKVHNNKFIEMSMNKIERHDSQGNSMIEITYNQPLIGAGAHDFWIDQLRNDQFMTPSIIGGDEHDNWEQKNQEIQNNMPLIGGDGHDNWLQKRMEEEQNNNIKNSFPKRLFGLKKQKQVQIPQKILLGGQADIKNHNHNSDVMPGSSNDKQGKQSIKSIINGVFNFVKELKNPKTNQKSPIEDIQENNIEKEEQTINKPQVLTK